MIVPTVVVTRKGGYPLEYFTITNVDRAIQEHLIDGLQFYCGLSFDINFRVRH